MKQKRLAKIKKNKQEKQSYKQVIPTRRRTPTNPLAIKPDRFTYTFLSNNNVISIHYDMIRSAIFMNGHNIKYLKLSKDDLKSLMEIAEVVSQTEDGKLLANEYLATLGRYITDNIKE